MKGGPKLLLKAVFALSSSINDHEQRKNFL